MNNRLIWKLSFRYLLGRGSANATPVLSRISMGAVAVSSAAMIIIFSVFNGLETLVKDTYKVFYPDIKISAARGKFFAIDSNLIKEISHLEGVQIITPVAEDKVFAVNNDQQNIITLKGIENDYIRLTGLKQYITSGSADSVSANGTYSAIAGRHIMNELGADMNTLSRIVLNYVNPENKNPAADPLNAIVTLKLYPAGEFEVSDEFDGKYVLAPLVLVQQLFHQSGKCSSIEIKTAQEDVTGLQKQIQQLLGSSYKVENRFEQNKSLYMVESGEKWAVFAILVLVLFIATFNMTGALSMLVLQKRKDIAILRAMGAQGSTIRSVFLLEGILWSLTGGLIGIVLGCGICLAQLKWKIIKMGSSFLVDAFPVQIQLRDLLLDLVTILIVGLIVSWYPAIRATRAVDPSLKST